MRRSNTASKMDALRKRRDEATMKLRESQSAGEGAWEDLKTGIETAWDSLGNALKSATCSNDRLSTRPMGAGDTINRDDVRAIV